MLILLKQVYSEKGAALSVSNRDKSANRPHCILLMME
jgi:hypothetical protein